MHLENRQGAFELFWAEFKRSESTEVSESEVSETKRHCQLMWWKENKWFHRKTGQLWNIFIWRPLNCIFVSQVNNLLNSNSFMFLISLNIHWYVEWWKLNRRENSACYKSLKINIHSKQAPHIRDCASDWNHPYI